MSALRAARGSGISAKAFNLFHHGWNIGYEYLLDTSARIQLELGASGTAAPPPVCAIASVTDEKIAASPSPKAEIQEPSMCNSLCFYVRYLSVPHST
jgi:hypothetical protein